MASQLQKYLLFNASSPTPPSTTHSLAFLPPKLTPRNCIYYETSKPHTSRTNSQRSALSERSGGLSSRSSFMGLINPPPKINGAPHRIHMHACTHPNAAKRAQQLQQIAQKRSQVERLRRSLSQRKVTLQNKYGCLLQRSTAIRRYYEQQKARQQ